MVGNRRVVGAQELGCAMLSMHSIREQGGARDVAWMIDTMTRVLQG